jgi:aspartate aminotransferase
MEQPDRYLSQMAHGLVGSEILKIAAEIRAKAARGEKVYNLTVGDFRPDQFPVPELLRKTISEAYAANETNYPPSDGMPELRQAISEFYADRLGLEYQIPNIVVTGGVRPSIYGAYRVLLDPGETLVFPVPSWNNNHYAWLLGSKAAEVIGRYETHFLPTAEDLKPYLHEARVILLNSPLNPAGTVYTESQLERVVAAILDENRKRDAQGRRPVMLVYDQVYWMLTFGTARHYTPVGIDARMREFTIFTDGISKAFAATGLRVGWAVGPERYIKPICDVMGHVGAWAPRPEQIGAARLLRDGAAIDAYHGVMKKGIEDRLHALHDGFEAMRRDGYPVESIAPQGAIYLSARIDLIGRSVGSRKLNTNEEIRRFLLAEASLAVVPFQAFGLKEETGWFRLSVGALPLADVEHLFPALRRALDECQVSAPVSAVRSQS